MKLFLADSAKHLRPYLRKYKCEIGQYESSRFADGEWSYRLKEEVKGESVAIIGSILPDPKSLFEIMALHYLAIENGARETILIIPYLGYARQDRPTRLGEGSIGIMIIKLLQKMRPSQIFLMDVHSDLIRKAFSRSVKELSALPLIVQAISKHPPDVIVSPDLGFVKRAEKLQKLLKPEPSISVIEKVRPKPNIAIAKRLFGDVRRKQVLIVDDIIDTGETLREAVKLVAQNGTKTIHLAATHGIFSGKARDHLLRLPIEKLWVTNTLPQTRDKNLHILDITPLILKALSPIQ